MTMNVRRQLQLPAAHYAILRDVARCEGMTFNGWARHHLYKAAVRRLGVHEARSRGLIAEDATYGF
jgi:hypothetical protein